MTSNRNWLIKNNLSFRQNICEPSVRILDKFDQKEDKTYYIKQKD